MEAEDMADGCLVAILPCVWYLDYKIQNRPAFPSYHHAQSKCKTIEG
jgi:hypothetical protein